MYYSFFSNKTLQNPFVTRVRRLRESFRNRRKDVKFRSGRENEEAVAKANAWNPLHRIKFLK